jgi:hypothetical protein
MREDGERLGQNIINLINHWSYHRLFVDFLEIFKYAFWGEAPPGSS